MNNYRQRGAHSYTGELQTPYDNCTRSEREKLPRQSHTTCSKVGETPARLPTMLRWRAIEPTHFRHILRHNDTINWPSPILCIRLPRLWRKNACTWLSYANDWANA